MVMVKVRVLLERGRVSMWLLMGVSVTSWATFCGRAFLLVLIVRELEVWERCSELLRAEVQHW